MNDDEDRTPILALAGRTIATIDRDPEVPLVLRIYDEHGRLMFKTISLWDEDGFMFDTSAIDEKELSLTED